MKITISKDIKSITEKFNVGVLECNVEIYNDINIEDLMIKMEQEISNNINIEDVVNLDIIIDGRNAYKKYGKDPSRYRLAVESLYRRLSKGNSIYRVNNVVDLGNLISLKTRRSVAVLDYEKIVGDILIRLGNRNDDFYGIGRGKINIDKIPLYADELGPFGSTTSDTLRTMITENTKKVLLFIISFGGVGNLEDELEYCADLYSAYAKASNIMTYIL